MISVTMTLVVYGKKLLPPDATNKLCHTAIRHDNLNECLKLPSRSVGIIFAKCNLSLATLEGFTELHTTLFKLINGFKFRL